jgi:hypothetical protein
MVSIAAFGSFTNRGPKWLGVLAPASLAYLMILPGNGETAMKVLLHKTSAEPSVLGEYTKSRYADVCMCVCFSSCIAFSLSLSRSLCLSDTSPTHTFLFLPFHAYLPFGVFSAVHSHIPHRLTLTRAGSRHPLLRRFPSAESASLTHEVHTLEYMAISHLQDFDTASEFRRRVHLESLADVPLRKRLPPGATPMDLVEDMVHATRPDATPHSSAPWARESAQGAVAVDRVLPPPKDAISNRPHHYDEHRNSGSGASAPPAQSWEQSQQTAEWAHRRGDAERDHNWLGDGAHVEHRPASAWHEDQDACVLDDQQDSYAHSSAYSSPGVPPSSSGRRRTRTSVDMDGQGWPIQQHQPDSSYTSSRGHGRDGDATPASSSLRWSSSSSMDDSDVDADPYA